MSAVIGSNNSAGCDCEPKTMRVGVLAMQGAYAKHCEMLAQISGVEPILVRTVDELSTCDGLIIPGGESTTVGKLMERYGLDVAIKERAKAGMPVWGTCMGMIVLATDIVGSTQQRLGLIDITVRRNAFGRQVDSFEADVNIDGIEGGAMRAVFIRAPYSARVGEGVQSLCTLDTGEIILVRQKNVLASAFHPELTDDTRLHEYFVQMVSEYKQSA